MLLFCACDKKHELDASGQTPANPTTLPSTAPTTPTTGPTQPPLVLDESYLQYVYEGTFLCYCEREHINPLFICMELLAGSDPTQQIMIQVGEQAYVGTFACRLRLHDRNCNVYGYAFGETYELIFPEDYDKLTHLFALPDCLMLFYEDGSPYFMDFMGMTTDTSLLVPVATGQEVTAALLREKVEAMLADYMNPESYAYLETEDAGQGISYKYYNMVDGYELNSVYVSISEEGYLETVRFTDYFVDDRKIGPENCDFVINKEMEKALLELKLKDMYATDDVAYLSYSVDEAHICVVEGVLYIQYSLLTQLSCNGQIVEQMVGPLLIPVSIVMA